MCIKRPHYRSLKTGGILSEEIACFILVCQYRLNQSVHGNKILSDFQTGKKDSNSYDVHHHYDKNNLLLRHMYFSFTYFRKFHVLYHLAQIPFFRLGLFTWL